MFRPAFTIQEYLSVMDRKTIFHIPADGEGINTMFLLEYACRQSFGIIPRLNRYHRLDDVGPAIQIVSHEMDARAVLGYAGGEGACVRIKSTKCRQE